MPVFFSSAIKRIVNAGMKKNNDQYAIEKNERRLACPTIKMSAPDIQVKKPLKPRNRMIIIKAISESKKEFSSRIVIIQIVFIFLSFNSRLSLGICLRVLFRMESFR